VNHGFESEIDFAGTDNLSDILGTMSMISTFRSHA
jgi:hypothetical protein